MGTAVITPEQSARNTSQITLMTHSAEGRVLTTMKWRFGAVLPVDASLLLGESWQRQCSPRCRQRSYIQRKAEVPVGYFGA